MQLKKFLAYFEISLKTSLAYRARGFIWFLNDSLPVLTVMLFFSAVFVDQTMVAGYSKEAMMTYYILTLTFNTLLEPHPEFSIANDINTGDLSSYLLRPLKYLKYYAVSELAYKLNRIVFIVPLILLIWGIAPKVFVFASRPWWLWLFLASLLPVAYLVFYLIKVIIALVAFWSTEINWLIGISELLGLFFSGLILPLNIMPPFFQKIANLLPFKYLIYTPSRIILYSGTVWEYFFNLAVLLFWLLCLYLLVGKMWQAGLKKYAAFGS